jgi:DNA-binding CsgD family transcriptional regulator
MARESLVHLAEQQDAGLVLNMCSLALRAHADLVTSRADRVLSEALARETADLVAMARGAAERDTGALANAYLLLCEAEADRAALRQSAEPWTAVVAAWQRLGCPYPVAYAQWRQAEELFGARARAQGTRAVAAALRTASRLRCEPLETSLRTLARHAGLSAAELEDAPPEAMAAESPEARSTGPLTVPLTPRERDVLKILTEGFSNQQIARRLFITESTVSVHVSHIIAKLGVSNRLQAASAAHRLNLFPSTPEQE